MAGPGIVHEAQDRPYWKTKALPSSTGTLQEEGRTRAKVPSVPQAEPGGQCARKCQQMVGTRLLEQILELSWILVGSLGFRGVRRAMQLIFQPPPPPLHCFVSGVVSAGHGVTGKEAEVGNEPARLRLDPAAGKCE